MTNEGPATGAADNGPHEVNPDPSKGNVDAPHQRAETSSILGNLERMSNNSGLHNSPGLYRAAHPHTMLGELALGQIHNWQMYTSTRSQQGDRDGCMSRIMDRLDDLRELNQLHVVRLDRYATDINQKVGGIQSSVSALEWSERRTKDDRRDSQSQPGGHQRPLKEHWTYSRHCKVQQKRDKGTPKPGVRSQ